MIPTSLRSSCSLTTHFGSGKRYYWSTMVFASRGLVPFRAFSPGRICLSVGGAGRRRLTFPALRHVASAPPSPSCAAPTNPSDRRHRHLTSPFPSQNVASFIRLPVCGLVWSCLGMPPANMYVGAPVHRLMSSSASEAARYFEGPWHEKYWLLEEYKERHGNCLVPPSYYADGDVKLGSWVSGQRQLASAPTVTLSFYETRSSRATLISRLAGRPAPARLPRARAAARLAAPPDGRGESAAVTRITHHKDLASGPLRCNYHVRASS